MQSWLQPMKLPWGQHGEQACMRAAARNRHSLPRCNGSYFLHRGACGRIGYPVSMVHALDGVIRWLIGGFMNDESLWSKSICAPRSPIRHTYLVKKWCDTPTPPILIWISHLHSFHLVSYLWQVKSNVLHALSFKLLPEESRDSRTDVPSPLASAIRSIECEWEWTSRIGEVDLPCGRDLLIPLTPSNHCLRHLPTTITKLCLPKVSWLQWQCQLCSHTA